MFDRYVADKRKKRPLLYILLMVSTVIWGLVIVGLIIYSIMHVEEVQPPLLTVTFINAAAPPPPPPPPAKRKAQTPKTPKPVVQPQKVPTEIVQPKEKEAPEPEDSGDDGVEGGVEGGVPGGVVGGAVGAPPPPPPVKPVNKPAFMVKKDKVGGEMPRLPDVIKTMRRGTTVMGNYKVCVDVSGAVSNVSPVVGVPGADDVIMSTLRTWRFKPQPIPVCFIEIFQWIIE